MNLRTIKSALAAVLVFTPAIVHAQWLTHTGTGVSSTGTFSGVGGAYAGTVKTQITKIVDGGNDGVPGLTPGSFGSTTAAFDADYPLNQPGATFDSLAFGYNHTQDSYLVVMDFSGLANGVLPAGSTLAVADLDIEEDFIGMKALDQSLSTIQSPWLSQYAGLKGFLDYNDTDGYQPNLTQPTWGFTTDHYDFVGIDHNESSGLIGFETLTDVRAITFGVRKHSSTGYTHVGGAGIGIAAVPEPASLTVFGLVGAALLRRRRSR
ncbi:MAG: PEP-CTERM sorting domain-containing protein [Armatimonadetes bacterium]|nr:PEP-CTERM sorting domain-containing protein [Armatimonadota bacterium]